MSWRDTLLDKWYQWLLRETPPRAVPLSDFERLSHELKPCDVILVEGRSRISDIVRTVTQSTWSHSALYIGRLHDVENPIMRARIQDFYRADPSEQLLVEGILGKGTIVTPLATYRQDHLRICRPRDLVHQDAQQVLGFAIGKLGTDYNVRQVIDLMRLLLPWGLLPRHWHSTLFEHQAGGSMRTICSSVLAEAFQSVKFPILPLLRAHSQKGVQLFVRNPRLFTPRDFDYSPYFDIIKYPFVTLTEHGLYRQLPWTDENNIHHDHEFER